jgi:hypothetical protein
VLAYLFWHRPREGADVERYEQAQLAFHRSLARSAPAGLRASTISKVAGLPYGEQGDDGAGYEDWYLLEDFAALGVLGEAAVGRGHRTAHDHAASAFGAGSAGLYGLVEGESVDQGIRSATLAVWVARPVGSTPGTCAELLGDGMEPGRASVWRRQLVLGPAPEFCVLADEVPTGVGPERLPAGWEARTIRREVLFDG